MNTRQINERSVIMITSDIREEDLGYIQNAFTQWGGYKEIHWRANHPEESLKDLKDDLDGSGRAIVYIDRAYSKAVKQIRSTVTKKGYDAYIVSEKWSQDATYLEIPFDLKKIELDKTEDRGPFDIIGDVHGCAIELMMLLEKMGHATPGWTKKDEENWVDHLVRHEGGRKVILLGDLVDRGPKNLTTMRISKKIEEFGGLRVLGNHDAKVGKWLCGRDVKMGLGQEPTMEEFKHMTAEERAEWGEWMLDAEAHYIFDGGKLAVAHAGINEEYLGRKTNGAISMALYGLPSKDGEVDEDGYPVSEDWALTYNGETVVVHGHVVYNEPRETNGKVIAVDTGCVFGGKLTAYRWPERDYISVEAQREWWSRK